MPPTLAGGLLLSLFIWPATDAMRDLYDRWPALRRPLLILTPFLLGVGLAHIPGLVDGLVFGWLGYEPPLKYLDPLTCGAMAGMTATVMHATGLRRLITENLVGRAKALFGGTNGGTNGGLK